MKRPPIHVMYDCRQAGQSPDPVPNGVTVTVFDNNGPEGEYARFFFARSAQAVTAIYEAFGDDIAEYNFRIEDNKS